MKTIVCTLVLKKSAFSFTHINSLGSPPPYLLRHIRRKSIDTDRCLHRTGLCSIKRQTSTSFNSFVMRNICKLRVFSTHSALKLFYTHPENWFKLFVSVISLFWSPYFVMWLVYETLRDTSVNKNAQSCHWEAQREQSKHGSDIRDTQRICSNTFLLALTADLITIELLGVLRMNWL